MREGRGGRVEGEERKGGRDEGRAQTSTDSVWPCITATERGVRSSFVLEHRRNNSHSPFDPERK